METITKRLADLIALKGIKNTDIAKATETNASTISRILNGIQTPTADTLYKFAQYFDVTMEYLLTGKNIISNNCTGAITEPNELKLIAHYRQMNIVDQEDILLIAEMKAKKNKRKGKAMSSHSENDKLTSETA